MIIGVCIVLIVAFCTAMAFVSRLYKDDNDEREAGFLATLFLTLVFAIGSFFLLLFAFNVLSHDIR